MVKVTEIAFTGYPVTDIARARGFYEGVLNLKQSCHFGHDGKEWVEYDIGPSTLAISNMAPEWQASSQGPSVALEVADLDAAIAAVRAAGVRITMEPMTSPSCRLALVLDPDGNTVALHQRNTP